MATAPWSERLGPLDAMFLEIEDVSAHMHVGAVLVCEGAPPSHAELLRHLAARLDRVPRYRQRLSSVPLGLGRPVWVDDADFDVTRHVRRIVLDEPGEDGFPAAAARIFSEPLDHRRPLWGIDLVEARGGSPFALVTRTHHSLIDGIGGCDIVAAITGGEPWPMPAAPEPTWSPRPEPDAAARLMEAFRGQAARALELLVGLAQPASEGRRVLGDVAHGLVPLAALALRGRAPHSSLNATIGPRRRYAMARIDLGAVRRVRAGVGTTVNDVLLSAVAGGLRTLLAGRGATPRRAMRAFVPVNDRPVEAQGAPGNFLSAVYCPLPVDEPDPLRRLRAVSTAMDRLKEMGEARGVVIVRHLLALVPPPLATRVARLELAYRRFNVVVSNIPGPRAPRYLLGRRMRSFYPTIPLAPGQTVSVGLLSYAGTVYVGVLGDADRAPDLPLLGRAIEDAFAELEERAGALAEPEPVRAPGAPVAEAQAAG